MEQKICKYAVIPESHKRPNNPFCSQSGLSLEKNGNGSFVCPEKCAALLEVLRTGGQRLKDGNSSSMPR